MRKKKTSSTPSKPRISSRSATNTAKQSKESDAPNIKAPVVTPKATHPAPKAASRAKTGFARGSLPAEAALSFLRDTKGAVSWSLRELSQTLNISREEAERVVALLQMQGYVQPEPHKAGEWMTTSAGETVSGAKPPRFDRATLEGALASLKQRIEETNRDRAAKFEVTGAVAFGDFLAKDRARVQAADVGVELARKNPKRAPDEIAAAHSAVDAREEQSFLRQLRGRSALINLKLYAEWMAKRTHQKLL